MEKCELRVEIVDAAQLDARQDLLARTHEGDLDLIIVRQFYPADALAAIVRRLETEDFPAFQTDIPPGRAGRVLGHPLDLARPDLTEYFADAEPFEKACRALFSRAGDWEVRAADLLARLSGRQVAVLEHGDGRRYVPATIRRLAPGGHIRLHCEDQKLLEPAKRRIHEVAYPHVSSFYMMLGPPESGGELVLYDLKWADVDETHLVDGRCEPSAIVGRYAALDYAMEAGDVALFGNGRIHEIRPVGGARNRWTIGGFFVFSSDDRWVYYFS